MTIEERQKTGTRLVQLQAIVDKLSSSGINYFVTGGFGEDGCKGQITRHHKDVDILVPSEKKEDLLKLFPHFEDKGYKLVGGGSNHVDLLFFEKRTTSYFTRSGKKIPREPLPNSFFTPKKAVLCFDNKKFCFTVAPEILINYFKPDKYRNNS